MELDTKVMLIELDSMKRKEEEYIKEVAFLKDEINKYKALIAYADAKVKYEMVTPIKYKNGKTLTVLEYQGSTFALVHKDQFKGVKKK